jgi:YHS domain-containing protein
MLKTYKSASLSIKRHSGLGKGASFGEISFMKIRMLLSFLFFSLVSFSQNSNAIHTRQFNLDDGVAIKGYDPVAYFTQNKAVKGRKEFSYVSQGVVYHFANTADLQTFESNPTKYEPQYGGWCAYAMGHDGSKVEVDPETFKIINGKLFLFYNRFFNNTLKTWNQDEIKLHAQADANWEKILQH